MKNYYPNRENIFFFVTQLKNMNHLENNTLIWTKQKDNFQKK